METGLDEDGLLTARHSFVAKCGRCKHAATLQVAAGAYFDRSEPGPRSRHCNALEDEAASTLTSSGKLNAISACASVHTSRGPGA
jgi:hypothetical protein